MFKDEFLVPYTLGSMVLWYTKVMQDIDYQQKFMGLWIGLYSGR